MELTQENLEELKAVFQSAIQQARKTRISGFRAEDKSAWFSPQRDMINQIPNILKSASFIASLEMAQKDQEKIGNLPVDLFYAASGDRGGVLCIPEIVRKYMDECPEQTLHYLALVGYSTLFNFAAMPANYVQPDGTLDSDLKSDTQVTYILELLTEDTRKKVISELKEDKNYEVPYFLMSENMQQVAQKLSEVLDSHLSNKERKEKANKLKGNDNNEQQQQQQD